MIDECLVLQSWFYLTYLFKSFYLVYLQNMHGSVFKGITHLSIYSSRKAAFQGIPKY